MTEILSDSLDVTMTIDGKEWLVSDLTVELSLASTPNYVHINKMVPDPTVTYEFSNTTDLLNRDFELHVDNQLISNRDTDATEETLLFKGNLANMSPTGTRSFEGIAYDPSQQGIANPPDDDGGEGEDSGPQSNNGSMLNERITIKNPYASYYTSRTSTEYDALTVEAKELVGRITDKLGIDDTDIQLTEGGVEREGKNGTVSGAYNRELRFDKFDPLIETALESTAERTESTFWFDKSGTFHFGVPDPDRHKLQLITETSDGVSTPPYQSVKVVGSGVASSEGHSRATMRPEERIVSKWLIGKRITLNGDQETFIPTPLHEALVLELPEPTFVYRDMELSTQAQADSAAHELVKNFIQQQASGKVTVSGYPEVTPLDAIVMPSGDPEHTNYSPRQPMGGRSYSVYKIVHKLNPSDGFKSVIHVGGLVGMSRIIVESQREPVVSINDRSGDN